jgi:hypothetical protein
MKKLCLLILALCVTLTLVGCGTQYEDTNGAENFHLQTLTDENIIRLDTGASGLSYSETSLGGLTSSEYSSNNFNGVEQLYLTNFLLPSDAEIYVGHLNVKSGNFRLVVINNDKIIFEVPLDAFGETYRFEDLSGSFSVHVAGERAAFSFHLEVKP